MREREMRQRVESFLQTRLRAMLMPATLGVGLAIGGCGSNTLNSDDGGKSDVQAASDGKLSDASGAVALYMAAMPDAASDSSGTQTSDAGLVVRYGAPTTSDAGTDASAIVVLYMAQMPSGT